MKTTIKVLGVVMTSLLALVSCNKEPQGVPVTGVKLNETAILLYEGDSQTLKATVAPSNATDAQVVWSTDNAAVATVADGVVTGHAAGEASITATVGEFKATCSVIVRAKIVSVQSVALDKQELTILVGEKASLIATVTPENATNAEITWTSSSPEVVSVNASGEIEGLKAGTSTITVTTVDGGKTASCDVLVDASEMHVSFESNGGSKIDDVVVKKNETLIKPADPVKTGLSTGLYTGNLDPDKENPVFQGWYTDADCTNAYDFSLPVTADFTLYAKWSGPASVDLSSYITDEEVSVLHATMTYLNTQTFDVQTEFTLVISEDVQLYNGTETFSNPNAKLYIVGCGTEREIKSDVSMNMIGLSAGVIVLGKNLRIYNTNLASFAVVNINDGGIKSEGTVIMEEGCRLSGSRNGMGNGVAVLINSGVSYFIMNGGEISDNEGVGNAFCQATVGNVYGAFTMNGGVICNNRIDSTSPEGNLAGGVYQNNWSNGNHNTVKNGGEIRDNVVTRTVEDGAEIVGRRGNQVLVVREAANLDRVDRNAKIDENIGADLSINFDTDRYISIWKLAPLE